MKRGLPSQQRVVLANGKRPCRGCAGEVPKGRRTWCSNDCRDRHYMALSSYARSRVEERDKGVCALCGCDAGLADRIMARLYWRNGRSPDHMKAMELLSAAWGKSPSYGWRMSHSWEADHIVPLIEGGTNDLSNYRTLCVPCHKTETRSLAARRATARRRQLPIFDEHRDSGRGGSDGSR